MKVHVPFQLIDFNIEKNHINVLLTLQAFSFPKQQVQINSSVIAHRRLKEFLKLKKRKRKEEGLRYQKDLFIPFSKLLHLLHYNDLHGKSFCPEIYSYEIPYVMSDYLSIPT